MRKNNTNRERERGRIQRERKGLLRDRERQRERKRKKETESDKEKKEYFDKRSHTSHPFLDQNFLWLCFDSLKIKNGSLMFILNCQST